jgi:hypothetical protein
LAGSHESVVQGSLSSQLGAPDPTHFPAEQLSTNVHLLLSSHGVVSSSGGLLHTPAVHEFRVHSLLSLQLGPPVPAQVPLVQTSPDVQPFSSSQAVPFASLVKTQPVEALQLFDVHGLLSSHFSWVPPTHAPFEHLSPIVHTLLSLHATPLFGVYAQPVVGLQLSVVQGLLSLQLSFVPGPHAPAAVHLSPVVQAFPSLQAAPVNATCLQGAAAFAGSQLSAVQGLLSSQFKGAPP